MTAASSEQAAGPPNDVSRVPSMTHNLFYRAISYLRDLPAMARAVLADDPLQTVLRETMLVSKAADSRPSSRMTVVVAVVEDTFYLGLFGQIVAAIRTRVPIRAELFVLRSLNLGEGRTLTRFLNARCVVGWLTSVKWIRLYRSFADRIAYSSVSLRPLDDLVDLAKAWTTYQALENKSQVLQMTIHGVPVGDLVNDSFLRFKPAASLQVRDKYLWIVIWQARRDVRRAKRYFARVRPRLLLTSYTAYVQHGIAVRVALMSGVKVFSFGNYQEFAKPLALGDWLHSKNASRYAIDFESLPDKESKLAEADRALADRMSGVVDSATAYMKVSAYRESTDVVPDVSNAVIVFLHDFYDSPHGYYDLVFSDFWDWICTTIETLAEARIPFFIKPHPNQVAMSGHALRDLLSLYPNVRVVPQSITNKQLAAAGMRCAVTVYGTVAHEMAYLGVPTIACARHPHVSFGFCQTAKSRVEYVEALRNVEGLKFDKARARDESLRFFHMHNRNLDGDELALRNAVLDLRMSCANPDSGVGDVPAQLQQLGQLPAFQSFITMCADILAANTGAAGRSTHPEP